MSLLEGLFSISARPLRNLDPRVQVLLLDVDGVLVQPPELQPPEWFGVRMRREHPAPRRFFAGPFRSASSGRSDILEQLPAYPAETGQHVTLEAFLQEGLDSENVPLRSMLEAARELRVGGWGVYLATNQEAHRVRYLLEVVGLGEVVDGHFASCAVGRRKPDSGYSAEVARRLETDPQNLIF